MAKELGIPYMGSKRKLSRKIINFIKRKNPNAKYFYDLFGGGGAMSFEALQHKQFKEVYYNELNTGVVELLKKIRDEGVQDPKFFEWVSRETFLKHKDDNDWYGGFIKTCWCFGNNVEKGYLFGKDVEPLKKLAHLFIVNKDQKAREELEKRLGVKIPKFESDKFGGVQERRIHFARWAKAKAENTSLVMLEQLSRLQQLQQLQQLERLKITNLSYDEVAIITPLEETIIYLDPPYEDTAKYQKGISHKELLKWIKKQLFKVYVSSYKFDGLKKVASFKHRSTLSATNNIKEVSENLYLWDGINGT